MTFLKNREGDNKQVQGALLTLTFLLHLAWTAYVFNEETMGFIENFQRIISTTYALVGFEWSGMGAYLVTATLLSSFFTNSIRRVFEGALMGWPRFGKHDEHSLRRALMLMACYGLLMYFAVGFFGEKYSSRPLDVFNVVIIAASTYLVGFLVDFADDLFSGIYFAYLRGNE